MYWSVLACQEMDLDKSVIATDVRLINIESPIVVCASVNVLYEARVLFQ